MGDATPIADRVKEEVQKQYPDAIECRIIDHSGGCGAKLELIVVSDSFEGVPLLKRHREVQNNLKEKGLFEEIHALQVHKQYPDAIECKILDHSGHSGGCDGAKLELIIVSNSFEGMPLLKRHREVQNNLKEKGLSEDIHALHVRAWTGAQWEKKNASV